MADAANSKDEAVVPQHYVGEVVLVEPDVYYANGPERVPAVITHIHDDGTVDLSVLPTTRENVEV